MQEFSSPEAGGGAEVGGRPGEGGAEGTQAPDEAAQMFEVSPEAAARYKAQQAAIQQIQKEEKKHRQKDSKVAQILLRFIKDTKRTRYFILLARLIARNVPSAFLLAILSLIDRESQTEVTLQLEGAKDPALQSPEQNNLPVATKGEFQNLPPEMKHQIDVWTKYIYEIGMLTPKKILQTTINPDGKIEDALPQLTAFITMDFLTENKIEAEFQDVKQFMTTFYTSLLKKLHEIAGKQKEIAENTENTEENTENTTNSPQT